MSDTKPEKTTDEKAMEAYLKWQAGGKPTDHEWVLIAYSFPPSCHACGSRAHR
jgi:hypothetical protein